MERDDSLKNAVVAEAKVSEMPSNLASMPESPVDETQQTTPGMCAHRRRTGRTGIDAPGDIIALKHVQEHPAEGPSSGGTGDGNTAAVERLMMVEEVASMLAISVRFVWRLVTRGDLKRPVRLGRSCRWLYSDVLAYVNKLKGDRDQRAR